MKSNKLFIPLLIGIGVVILFGIYIYEVQSSAQNSQQSVPNRTIRTRSQQNSETTESPSAIELSEEQTKNSAEYVEYSPAGVATALSEGKKVLLFFHAGWCPTCKVADSQIIENISQLPENLVIFKTDYDTEENLKNKYSVTYQHTFVQIDENQEEVISWNGGAVSEINSKLQ